MELSIVPAADNPSRVTVIRSGAHSPGIFCSAKMSPNAAMIAIVEPSGSNEYETKVRITNRSGRTIAELGMGAHPVWSPDSTRLTIERVSTNNWLADERARDNLELFQADEQDRFASIVTGLPGNSYPDWDRDSSMFSVRKVYPPLLYVFDRNGRQVFAPVQVGYTHSVAEWSPDGQRLLVADPTERTVAVYDRHGTQTYAGVVPYEHSSVCWALDSTHLAIAPQADATQTITVLNIQDNTHTLQDIGGRADRLCWSPDRTRLFVMRPRYIDIRNGNSFALVASIPKNTIMEAFSPSPSNPKWSSDSSMIGIRTELPNSVVVLSKNGQRLLTIPLQERLQFPSLSGDFTYMLTVGRNVKVTCLAKWSDRTNNMFARQFRETVKTLMCVSRRLDDEDRERQLLHQEQQYLQQHPQQHQDQHQHQENVLANATGLPRLPVEIWLNVLTHLQAAPVRAS